MGRLNKKSAEAARAGAESLPAIGAERQLRLRGILIPLEVLAGRSVAECIDAISWAHNRRPLEARPAWIGELLKDGTAKVCGGDCAQSADCCGPPEPCKHWGLPGQRCDQFVERVLGLLHGKNLGARVELVAPARAYIYASHPYGPERSTTIDVTSASYALSASGSVVNPWDVCERLLADLRRRDP